MSKIRLLKKHRDFEDEALGRNERTIYEIVESRKEVTLDELERMIRNEPYRFTFTLQRSPKYQLRKVIERLVKKGFFEIVNSS